MINWILQHSIAQDLFATMDSDSPVVRPGSVDLVLTDPPYVISKKTSFQNKNIDGQYDGIKAYAITTEFGQWDTENGFTMEALEDTIRGMYASLRPGGTAIVFFDLWKVSQLFAMMERAGFERLTMMEWAKTNAVPINARASYLTNAREIAVYGVKPGGEATAHSPNPHGRYNHPIQSGKDRFHPTQKSTPLFQELIRTFSNPGDLVLDCFAGSATTGAAALMEGRRFVGSEPSDEYYEKAYTRLESLKAS
jgi:site-specific DNA-methyltransferase (adenine-specific)